MKEERIEKEELELIAEFHTELYECVECFEQEVIHNFLLDSSKSLEERKLICKALCSIVAQLTGGINLSSLMRTEKLRMRADKIRAEMDSYFNRK